MKIDFLLKSGYKNNFIKIGMIGFTVTPFIFSFTAGCGHLRHQRDVSPEVSKRPEFFTDEWPPTSYVEYKKLIGNGTLHDDMTMEEAQAILGKATGERSGYLEWYHNPEHRWHIAPYICAELRNGKLYNWQTGNK
jgi:hypothetical protein